MKNQSIRIVARCLFRNKEQILTISAQDPDKPEPHYGVPGGGVEFGETTAQALRREMREELGAEIADLNLLFVTEQIFTVQEQHYHEIIFLYEGRFSDPSFYAQALIPYIEGTGPHSNAIWMPISIFVLGEKRLIPKQLIELLKR